MNPRPRVLYLLASIGGGHLFFKISLLIPCQYIFFAIPFPNEVLERMEYTFFMQPP